MSEENKLNSITIVNRNKETIVYTGESILIQNFKGYSRNFNNIIDGSTHRVIETPYRYKHKKLQSGKWIMGVYEPALVLDTEYIIL